MNPHPVNSFLYGIANAVNFTDLVLGSQELMDAFAQQATTMANFTQHYGAQGLRAFEEQHITALCQSGSTWPLGMIALGYVLSAVVLVYLLMRNCRDSDLDTGADTIDGNILDTAEIDLEENVPDYVVALVKEYENLVTSYEELGEEHGRQEKYIESLVAQLDTANERFVSENQLRQSELRYLGEIESEIEQLRTTGTTSSTNTSSDQSETVTKLQNENRDLRADNRDLRKKLDEQTNTPGVQQPTTTGNVDTEDDDPTPDTMSTMGRKRFNERLLRYLRQVNELEAEIAVLRTNNEELQSDLTKLNERYNTDLRFSETEFTTFLNTMNDLLSVDPNDNNLQTLDDVIKVVKTYQNIEYEETQLMHTKMLCLQQALQLLTPNDFKTCDVVRLYSVILNPLHAKLISSMRASQLKASTTVMDLESINSDMNSNKSALAAGVIQTLLRKFQDIVDDYVDTFVASLNHHSHKLPVSVVNYIKENSRLLNYLVAVVLSMEGVNVPNPE